MASQVTVLPSLSLELFLDSLHSVRQHVLKADMYTTDVYQGISQKRERVRQTILCYSWSPEVETKTEIHYRIPKWKLKDCEVQALDPTILKQHDVSFIKMLLKNTVRGCRWRSLS